jgi:hypothetical protein
VRQQRLAEPPAHPQLERPYDMAVDNAEEFAVRLEAFRAQDDERVEWIKVGATEEDWF